MLYEVITPPGETGPAIDGPVNDTRHTQCVDKPALSKNPEIGIAERLGTGCKCQAVDGCCQQRDLAIAVVLVFRATHINGTMEVHQDFVITSYSIHYTKLYERGLVDLKILQIAL